MELPEPDWGSLQNLKPKKSTAGKLPSEELYIPDTEPAWVPASQEITPHAPSFLDPIGMPQEEIRRVLLAWHARTKETMNIWEPSPIQAPFHSSLANIRLILGGNRSGKTLSAIFECVRAVTGTDPYNKYPKKNGILVVVAKDETSIADTIWERMYKPGAFQIIRDLDREAENGGLLDVWRAVLPNEPGDIARKSEWRPAEPFLPHRLCGPKDIVWAKAGRQVPAVVHIPSTGWEIRFFTGGSKPRAGFVCDLVWIDEELEKDLWAREMRSRIVDRGGRFIWSATPENCSQSLYNLYERHLQNDPNVDVFQLDTSLNKHISQEQWRMNSIDFSQEERDVKEKGKFKLGGQKIFHQFNWDKHSCKRFEIPRDWSRYISIDPGQVVSTAVFAAVPPDNDPLHAGRVYVYDELVVPDASGAKLAEAIKSRIGSDDFEAWIIDWHFARQKQTGSGLSINDQYIAAFKENGLTTNQFGVNFEHGADGHHARIEATRKWLSGERPTLQIFDHCRVIRSQMEKYHWARDRNTGIILDRPVKRNDHAVDCVGQLAAYDPQYRKKNIRALRGKVGIALARKNKGRKGGGGGTIFGPGGVSPPSR